MKKNFSRRSAIKKLAGTAAVMGTASLLGSHLEASEKALGAELKGRIKHSVCKWPYPKIPIEEFCIAAKKIGIQSVEYLGPDVWPILTKHGLTNAMPNGGDLGIEKGFCDTQYHTELIRKFTEVIPLAAKEGYDKIICFSGNRMGIDEETGLENCAKGLQKLMKVAETHKVTIAMELLNSKINHKDYMCDRSPWGIELVDRVGSDRFKLLYDIYHMQIMEGDVIRTIRNYHPYFCHYHTGGVPGRNEIDDTQELYYPAVIKAIIETGYTGFVGQEFVPKRPDALASLKQGVEICDV